MDKWLTKHDIGLLLLAIVLSIAMLPFMVKFYYVSVEKDGHKVVTTQADIQKETLSQEMTDSLRIQLTEGAKRIVYNIQTDKTVEK